MCFFVCLVAVCNFLEHFVEDFLIFTSYSCGLLEHFGFLGKI